MAFPSGTDWNTDWEEYCNENPGWDFMAGGPDTLIDEFSKALNERYRVIGAVNSDSSPFFSELSHNQSRNPWFMPSGGGGYGIYGLKNPFPQEGQRQGLNPGLPTVCILKTPTYNIPNPDLANSGTTWPLLQLGTIYMSNFFVRRVDGLTYESTSGTNMASSLPYYTNTLRLYPQISDASISGNPGFVGVAPIQATDWSAGFQLLPINGVNPLVGGMNRLPNSGVSYWRDGPPDGISFRRKFPREIWRVKASGEDGQLARFTTRSAIINLSLPFPDGSRLYNLLLPVRTNTTIDDLTYASGHATPNGLWDGSKANVTVPSGGTTSGIPDETGYGGCLMRYNASSGFWLLENNQFLRPDLVETTGVIQPGDYFGPWILNDIRDAINSMDKTWGWLHPFGSGITHPLDFHGSQTSSNQSPVQRLFYNGFETLTYYAKHQYSAAPSFYLYTNYTTKGASDGDEAVEIDDDTGDRIIRSPEELWASGYVVSDTGAGFQGLPKAYSSASIWQDETVPDTIGGPVEPNQETDRWDRIWNRTWGSVYASGHHFAQGIHRTYTYYIASKPLQGSSYEGDGWGDSTFDSNGDIAGGYSPSFVSHTASGNFTDSWTFQELGTAGGTHWTDSTVSYGSESKPADAYDGEARGYQALDIICLAEWEFEYTGEA